MLVIDNRSDVISELLHGWASGLCCLLHHQSKGDLDDKKGRESRGRGTREGKGRVRKRDVEGRECIGKESDRRRMRRR